MKYSESNQPIVCMMKNSTCYKGTEKMGVKGVLWHSTGANNPNVCRYVQPYEDDPNYDELIAVLGKNKYSNDWNHIYRKAGLNAWIGKLADGSVATVQTMPWDYSPWGCGAGKHGTCNDGWIQFEICEDSLTDKSYFEKIYKEACELTAYLCDMYDIDPYATVKHNGVTVPTILCHADSYKLGLGSGHADVLHWFNKHGKTMDDVRKDVAALMTKKTEPVKEEPIFVAGQEVQLLPDAKYVSGKSIPAWVFKSKLYVRGFSGKNIRISVLKSGAITGTVAPQYLVKVAPKEEFKPYKIKVTAGVLNIRAGAGTSYKINGTIKDKGVYTIVEEKSGWGKLKSGAGWIYLGYTKKV
jgi:hypothetical protein